MCREEWALLEAQQATPMDACQAALQQALDEGRVRRGGPGEADVVIAPPAPRPEDTTRGKHSKL